MSPHRLTNDGRMSLTPTPYRVACPTHGRVYLTAREYHRQMMKADEKWVCPDCGETADFDDENYETRMA